MLREVPSNDAETGKFSGPGFSIRGIDDLSGDLPQDPEVPLLQLPFKKVAVGPISLGDEVQRRRPIGVREFRTYTPKEQDDFVELYLKLLRRQSNRQHFVGIPETSSKLKNELQAEGIHGLAGINALGETFGFSTIVDPGKDQSDSFLIRLVILNSLQNKRGGEQTEHKLEGGSLPLHVGHDFLEKVVEWAFTTPSYDGRQRTALHTAIVMFVPNFGRVDALFTHFFGYDEEGNSRGGFDFVHRLPEQAKVLSRGRVVSRPVSRFALYRNVWEREQRLKPTS